MYKSYTIFVHRIVVQHLFSCDRVIVYIFAITVLGLPLMVFYLVKKLIIYFISLHNSDIQEGFHLNADRVLEKSFDVALFTAESRPI